MGPKAKDHGCDQQINDLREEEEQCPRVDCGQQRKVGVKVTMMYLAVSFHFIKASHCKYKRKKSLLIV